MAGFNKVVLMGNVVRDIELRSTPSGTSVCDITLAVSRKAKDRQEETAFVDCTLWGRPQRSLLSTSARVSRH